MFPVTLQPSYTVRAADWDADRKALRAIRYQVFVKEQGVPEELEWDDLDGRSHHVVALAPDGVPIGTGRLLPDGHIGRMAVLKTWRGRGVGSAVLKALVDSARASGFAQVQLHAQTHAIGFYARHGFAVQGGEFMEAGIPHVVMSRPIKAQAR
ncbi:MAG: GNAT family N-acetyltransferase [Betaproteobacteria bacterium]|nr:GNAT family N-acetyltransferase [Betaproteobacteria bacterium]